MPRSCRTSGIWSGAGSRAPESEHCLPILEKHEGSPTKATLLVCLRETFRRGPGGVQVDQAILVSGRAARAM